MSIDNTMRLSYTGGSRRHAGTNDDGGKTNVKPIDVVPPRKLVD